MSNTLDVVNNRKSIRCFLDKEVDSFLLKKMLKAVQKMPNSVNAQQTSLILVNDEVKKKELAKISDNSFIKDAPVLIVFVIDFYKIYIAAKKENSELIIMDNIESMLTGNTDVGILLGALTIIAESEGLGTCIVGGIRKLADRCIDILKLPKYTFPVAAMAIGYPANNPKQKPRFPYSGFVHVNTYKKEGADRMIDDYNKIMEDYLSSINRLEIEGNWSVKTCKAYRDDSAFPNLKEHLKIQGFNL